jgi:hypothetical protein
MLDRTGGGGDGSFSLDRMNSKPYLKILKLLGKLSKQSIMIKLKQTREICDLDIFV